MLFAFCRLATFMPCNAVLNSKVRAGAKLLPFVYGDVIFSNSAVVKAVSSNAMQRSGLGVGNKPGFMDPHPFQETSSWYTKFLVLSLLVTKSRGGNNIGDNLQNSLLVLMF